MHISRGDFQTVSGYLNQSVRVRLESTGALKHAVNMWLEVVARACLVWYVFIILVIAIGYLQLCVSSTTRLMRNILTAPSQLQAFLTSTSSITGS